MNDGRSRGVVLLHWGARSLGAILMLLAVLFVVAALIGGEGLPLPWKQPMSVNLISLSMITILAGLVIGWWKEHVAAILILGGYALFRLVEWRIDWPPTAFDILLLAGLLYGASWIARKKP